jgi:hypothetical protein
VMGRFPPRPAPATWKATAAGRFTVMRRMLAPPFLAGNVDARQRDRPHFALDSGARLSLLPPEGETSNDAAGFALCYGPHRCSPVTGPLTLGSDPARFQTKPPACYRASWQLPGPDSHRQATTSLRTRRSTVAYVTVSPPIPLGARKIQASLTTKFAGKRIHHHPLPRHIPLRR